MPRHKLKRQTSFVPSCQTFKPSVPSKEETIRLLPEEVEALYLMDMLELYQEDAANRMEVSRPTFARIIKTARHKVALGVLGGRTLELEVSKERYTVAFCSGQEREPFGLLEPKAPFIHVVTLSEKGIEKTLVLQSPLGQEGQKPAPYLSELFVAHRVNLFITSKLGEGLRGAFASRGIGVLMRKTISLEEILALW